MNLFTRIISFISQAYNAHRRQVDIDVLWPECKKSACDLNHARLAFRYHTLHDGAWTCLSDEARELAIASLT